MIRNLEPGDLDRAAAMPSLAWLLGAWLFGRRFETRDTDAVRGVTTTIRGYRYRGRVWVRQFNRQRERSAC